MCARAGESARERERERRRERERGAERERERRGERPRRAGRRWSPAAHPRPWSPPAPAPAPTPELSSLCLPLSLSLSLSVSLSLTVYSCARPRGVVKLDHVKVNGTRGLIYFVNFKKIIKVDSAGLIQFGIENRLYTRGVSEQAASMSDVLEELGAIVAVFSRTSSTVFSQGDLLECAEIRTFRGRPKYNRLGS